MSGWRRALATSVRFLVWAYPLSLFAVYAFLRATAETFWVSAICVYLPPQGYLLPGPILFLLALAVGPRRLALVPVAGMLFVVSFMMGFHFSLRDTKEAELTVVTMNVDSAYRGAREVAQGILEHKPDVAFLQEVGFSGEVLSEALRPTLPYIVQSGQFVVASRFPVSELGHPEPRLVRGRMRWPQFMTVQIDTPQGPIRAYNVHPRSPRQAFWAVRGQGFRKEIASGRLFRGEASEDIYKNFEIRRFELESVAESALRETLPTILVGDLNLPQMSPTFDATFGSFADSFREAGRGFGFTFPMKFPFLRLDRVLAIHGPRFVDSYVSCKGISDHICVVTRIDISPRSIALELK